MITTKEEWGSYSAVIHLEEGVRVCDCYPTAEGQLASQAWGHAS